MADNRLVVEVVGDTSKLQKSLSSAERDINRFATRTSNIHGTGADALLARVRKAKAEGQATLDSMNSRVDETSSSLGVLAAKGALAGFAFFAAANGVREFAEKLEKSKGRMGEVGRALDALFAADPAKFGSATDNFFGNTFEHDVDFALKSLFGIDRAAERVKKRFEEMWAAAHPPTQIPVAALLSTASGQQTFGISPLAGRRQEDPAEAALRKGITTTQRNRFFDSAISRAIDRVQDSELQAQLGKLDKISAAITKRLAKTKDVTRKLTLEDKLVELSRQRASVEAEIAANLEQAIADAQTQRIGTLQLAVDRAATTKSLDDDLQALQQMEKGLRAELASDKTNLGLQQQLLAVSQERVGVLEQQRKNEIAERSKRQFRALGLNAEGGDLVPGEANLRKQFASLQSRLATSFDKTGVDITLNSKLKNQFEGVRKVLSGSLGKTTADVRSRIQELFATIRDEFDKGAKGPLTKTTSLNSNAILSGLGLDRDTERQLRARLSQFNSAGVGINARNGNVVADRARPTNITVQAPPVYLDGKLVSSVVRKSNTIHSRQNPKQRRGVRRESG